MTGMTQTGEVLMTSSRVASANRKNWPL